MDNASEEEIYNLAEAARASAGQFKLPSFRAYAQPLYASNDCSPEKRGLPLTNINQTLDLNSTSSLKTSIN